MEITGSTFYFDWEIGLMAWLQANIDAFGVKLAVFLTQFGEPFVLILIVGMFYWGLDKKTGKHLAFYLFSVCLWGSMIKNIFLRRRPYFDSESIQCLRPAEKGDIYDISLQGFSFPSLHSANSTALFTKLSRQVNHTPVKIILWIIPFLVGLSRIILGVHYPTDVLAGWFFGLLVPMVIDILLKKLPDERWISLILLASGIPGFFCCRSADFYTTYGLVLGTAFAFWFEKKYVNFKKAKNFLYALLRVFFGFGIFLILSRLLKMPFPNELLSASTMTAFLLRTVRYAVTAFVILGVYPLCFNKGKADL